MQKSLVTTLLLSLSLMASAQRDNRTLFSVDDVPVTVDEFQYIYEKTNVEEGLYTKQSLEEYLGLYTNFKLKVAEARERGLDTVSSLQKELDGYKKQLSNNYLLDKEIYQRLTREVYDRMKYDVKLAHILVRTPSDTDTAYAHRRIFEIYDMLEKGNAWQDVVAQFSSDMKTRTTGGELGWRTAPLARGYHEIEKVVYDLQVGKYSQPVKSKSGYHIIKLIDKRPSYGQVEISQLFLRRPTNPKNIELVKKKADSLHQLLIFGHDFEELVRLHSEDAGSKNKGGHLGMVGVNNFEENFENRIFSIEADGQYSTPIETKLGWHIVKRIRKKDIASYPEMKNEIQNRLQEQGRFALEQEGLIETLKKEYNFFDGNVDIQKISAGVGRDVFTKSWKTPQQEIPNILLFSFDESDYKLKDFIQYLEDNDGFRAKHGQKANKKEALEDALEEYKKNLLIAQEELYLEEKYPEFRSLMREYREGILLFEIQKEEVWDKALLNPDALAEHYENHKNHYLEDAKIALDIVTINTHEESILNKIKKRLSKKSVEKTMKKFNKATQVISAIRDTMDVVNIEKKGFPTRPGDLSAPLKMDNGKTVLVKAVEQLPRATKPFEQARGAVIVDYQNKLEKEWVQRLKEKHKLSINQEVLLSLVR